jgi:hypothetical protein
MRVKCVLDSAASLPQAYRNEGYSDEVHTPASLGNHYVVYGMVLWRDRIRYLIVGDSMDVPILLPSEFFSIADSRLSSCWHHGPSSGGPRHLRIWGYREFAQSSSHYEELLDLDKGALDIFRRYRGFMDLEFPDPLVTQAAELIEKGWFLCPECLEAWHSESTAGMVQCSKCQTVLRNPAWTGDPW